MRANVLRRCVWVGALLMLASCTAGMPAYAGIASVAQEALAPGVAACLVPGRVLRAHADPPAWDGAVGSTCRAARPRKRSLRRAPTQRPSRRASGDGSCESMRTQRAAAYEAAGLKRDFALSSYWDNKVHQACR